MGPWQQTHLHDFIYNRPPAHTSSQGNAAEQYGALGGPENYGPLGQHEEVLKIMPRYELDLQEEDEGIQMPGMLPMRRIPKEAEEDVKLSDIYGEGGRLRDMLSRTTSEGGREFFPLIYLYDFGDNWEHELIFEGEALATAARPVFISAIGCGPVEDSGGTTGWETVKSAFRAQNPRITQSERRKWAREVSGLGDEFDPFKEPGVVQMNYEGRWENHLELYMNGSGDHGSMY
ncbi:hypothetical protein BDQ12DRAFT_738798 [Crucibulum laeve]|uniref:Plasmid pRiA4b Orf3-like domain-containing protein n=1 Tax=Crucibulum laeve TaxID=68775 RepID=A0A5C3LL38_9AGAR|nr:hypothetical protein BDQ12DRAFT_738798 [Crucibulum laeve]